MPGAFNKSLTGLRLAVNVRIAGMEAEVLEAVALSVNEGANEMQAVIIASETATGIDRSNNGGAPGRVDTGQMLHDVHATASAISPEHVLGQIGWQDPEDYYGFQEDGTRFIEPMHALMTAFILTRERVIGRLRRIVRGK